jgi:hypothetical protein
MEVGKNWWKYAKLLAKAFCMVGVFPHRIALGGSAAASTSEGDVGFATATAALDALIKLLEIGAISFGDQGTLDQGSPGEFIALFGDAPGTRRFIGVLHSGHQAEISGFYEKV